jgi:hypothetical protein
LAKNVLVKDKTFTKKVKVIYSVLIVELCLITCNALELQGEMGSHLPNPEILSYVANKTLYDNVVSVQTVGTVSVVHKQHIFEQDVNFGVLYSELNNMRLLLDNMNPNELREFEHLVNSSSEFKLSNTLSSNSMGHIKCNEHRGHMIDFQTFVKQKFSVKGNILLDNKIMIV